MNNFLIRPNSPMDYPRVKLDFNISVIWNRDVQGVGTIAQDMAQNFLEGERVLALDLETTGISTNNDRIVQIALIGSSKELTSVFGIGPKKAKLLIDNGIYSVDDLKKAPNAI
mgnify:CR=1 FL=1